MPIRANNKRRVCFVITSFIHYSRNFLILEALRDRRDVELHVVIGAAALLPRYTSAQAQLKELLKRDGFAHIHEAYFSLEGDAPTVKAKTTGLGIIEFSGLFNIIKPDLVVVRGDRFEVLAAAVAAAYLHIPVAHIEGGDVSGTLDESVRHAVTKLSQIHFVTNRAAERRVRRMGERQQYVFNFGSPDVEVAKTIASDSPSLNLGQTGSGANINLDAGYLMVMYHPAGGEMSDPSDQVHQLLQAVRQLDLPTLWFWPNTDAGAEAIAHELRVFNDKVKDHQIHFLRYVPPKDFIGLLRETKCLIGNSSAGLKECSYLGIPVVNIGLRQGPRLRAKNVLDSTPETKALVSAIRRQIKRGRYATSLLYAGENTSKKIAEVMATITLYVQKQFND